MEEKGSKGISLRKKRSVRPPISAPRQISSPIHQLDVSPRPPVKDLAPLAAPPPRPQAGGKTSDFVKRRYSTRFTTFPSSFDVNAPDIPTLPSLPNQYASNLSPGQQKSSARGTSPHDRQGISVDIKAIRDPSLQPEKYVADVLTDASEQEIRDYQDSLKKIRNRTSTDLQQNVYQNRTQFIKISREAEELKGEMRTLGGLINDLKTTVDALIQTSSNNPPVGSESQTSSYDNMTTKARKQSNRSSVANLEAMWNTQLQSLWKNVEGSQKFLPAAAGRHIVRDSPRWVELNAATWKPRRHIHMFLLNDNLLVASRKEKRVDQPTSGANGVKHNQQKVSSKLVAERCWLLQDIQMMDLSSNPSSAGAKGIKREREHLANAVTIRVGQESFTYRTDKTDSNEKQSFLLAFRKAVDELRKNLRVETEDTGKATESMNYLTARDPGLLEQPNLLDSLTENITKDRRNIMVDVDGKQQNLRWVDNQVDELGIDIALQRFEESVSRIERLRKLAKGLKGTSIARDLITFKADERAGKLAEILTRQLIETHSFLNATQRNVGWLVRLGFEDRAREAFLEARTRVLTKRTRQCIFEGDFQKYIFQISFVSFTIIKNTVSIYQACFPPLMMSACVRWAKEHVDEFNQILSRQMSSVERKNAVWQECVETVQGNSSLLMEAGLDFKDLLDLDAENSIPVNGNGRQDNVGLGLR
ncbi:MAG: exocyst complex component exo84 [Sclerophora amabilis]|nr:MAG: exocyst complex component exo84 [Sclerophora amabilis]